MTDRRIKNGREKEKQLKEKAASPMPAADLCDRMVLVVDTRNGTYLTGSDARERYKASYRADNRPAFLRLR